MISDTGTDTIKKARLELPVKGSSEGKVENSLCSQLIPCSHEARLVKEWTVDQVCQFLSTIKDCDMYVKVRLQTLTYVIYFEYALVEIGDFLKNESKFCYNSSA